MKLKTTFIDFLGVFLRNFRSSNIVFKMLFLVVFFFFCSDAFIFGQNNESRRLLEIKKNIKEKQLEQSKLVSQEKKIKRDVKSIGENIKQTEKKLEKCLINIKVIQDNLKNFSEKREVARIKSASWNRDILYEVAIFNKMTFMVSYDQNPLEYKVRQRSLEYKKDNFEKEKKMETFAILGIKKLAKSKKNLLDFQHLESKTILQNKDVLREKNKLLKTTVNKKLAAEQEIKSLNDSARALQSLINKINRSKNKRIIPSVPGAAISRIKRKKSLPWPMSGKVVVKFGKSKHPELDTYIISNGIKISANKDFSEVKSIDSGVVVFTGQFRSYGKIVIMDHGGSVFSIYGFLNKVFVSEEQKVSGEVVIANLGEGENGVLYFEIRHNNVPDDPLLWLKP
jgi:septal ring factor EnvC (AmiA/AmiB activator)